MVKPSLTAADDARWDAYVAGHPRANRYHLCAWRRIIESSLGHRGHYLMSSDEAGRVNGVLPLVRVRSMLFGDFLVSLPFVNYGGPCSDDPSIDRDLVNAAVDLARELGVRHLELRVEHPVDVDLQVRSRKVSMRLPLPSTPDELWAAIGTKMRNKIKRVERENLTVRMGREDQLDAFYSVFATNMRDLGTPVYSKRLFESVLRELPDSTWIGAIYLGDEPVAAGLIVGFRDAIEVPWASSLQKVNSIRANTLLYWHLLKFSCEQGYRVFDFGRSSPDSGPYEFKRQWGATPLPLNWQYWIPEGSALPDLAPDNPKYQQAIKIWQKLPVSLTRIVGPHIVRNIP